ncbi:MAG: hypothetical protein H8E44_35700 [Planctomycetes bacterium]|nr:hypothetical protein [Planctomycetota bacterium]MBL7043664.1 hypothetical protein [Pirellulaceae bacterium]
MRIFRLALALSVLVFPPALLAAVPQAKEYFKITAVDKATGRGVPLVELRTVNSIRYFTDSNGVVAFYEPGLMGQNIFFEITSHGYEFVKDGFGYRGARLKVAAGGEATLTLDRINIAERLYRMTGAGIYRDTMLTGGSPPTKQPVLNGLVFGSDSVVNTVFRGKVYWFWGDTNRPSYPLGNFHVPGAASVLPDDGGLDPEAGVDLSYFVGANGFAKPTCQMPGQGPTWINGLVTLKDDGRERLFAYYVKVAQPMRVYERGLVEFNDEKKQFEHRIKIDMNAPAYPGGHPFVHTTDGVEYVYFVKPYPFVRVRATPQDLLDLSKYEAFTCFREGGRPDKLELDRDDDGRLRYAWKRDTIPLSRDLQNKLTKDGRLKMGEGIFHFQDADTGKSVAVHGGSVYWNAYRGRWVMVALQVFGTSMLGEMWFAEADTPLGPWTYARKIVTHEKYSFYNPKQHPMFDKEGGRIIFFEGTYTAMFSGNPDRTPRYNYNQIMYKLDLEEPRLNLPVPVYKRKTANGDICFGTRVPDDMDEIAFYALERPSGRSIPIVATETSNGGFELSIGKLPGADGQPVQPVFHALSADVEEPPETSVLLYECIRQGDGQREYVTAEDPVSPEFKRSDKPLCRVWKNPAKYVTVQ